MIYCGLSGKAAAADGLSFQKPTKLKGQTDRRADVTALKYTGLAVVPLIF